MHKEGQVLLTRAEVAPAIAGFGSSATFKRRLEENAHRPELLQVVGRFIHFCSVFGGCQASFAGELAVRQDLFRDLDEPDAVADNSVDVAAGVFFGAIDEFGDREDPNRRTHRALAQATLKGLARYYLCDDTRLRQLIVEHAPTRVAITGALSGYGVNQVMDTKKVFNALGFHLGTEILADQEFNTLHDFFREHRPDLVAYLQDNEVRINGRVMPAYFWISRHSIADAEHFDAAVESANLALRYHVPTTQQAQAKAWILAGVSEIAKLAADFMNAVNSDGS